MASKLVVLGFDGASTAAGMLDVLRELESNDVIELEDAVVVSRDSSTERIFASAAGGAGQASGMPVSLDTQSAPRIEQTTQRRGRRAVLGGGLGMALGWLIGGPLGGMAIGTLIGGLRDHGIDDGFIHELSNQLQPDSSGLFLLVASGDTDKIMEQIRPFKGQVLHTTLSPEVDKQLHEALALAG